jgi:hypothetical protein
MRLTHESLGNIMLAFLLEKLDNWFECAEQRRVENYLAGSSDLSEIEARLRLLDRNGYHS